MPKVPITTNPIPDIPLQGQEKNILLGILLILALGSAFFSLNGAQLILMAHGEGLYTRIGAGVYALLSFATCYLLWRQAFLTLPMINGNQLPQALISLILTITLCLGVSSFSNVAYIAGGEAKDAHMAWMISETEDVVDAHFSAMQVVGMLSSDIGGRARQFSRMATDDRETGRYTGFPGGGGFSNAADSIADSLGALEGQIQAIVAESEALSAQARALLEAMRETSLRSDVDQDTRMAAILNQVNTLRALNGQVHPESLAGLITRETGRLTRFANAMGPTSPNPEVAAGQAEAFATLQAQMSDTAVTLEEAAGTLTVIDASEALRFEALSVMKLIFVYWDQFIPQWMGGLAIDLTPVVILILLGMRTQMLREHEARGAPVDMRVADVLKALKASQQIQDAARGQTMLELLPSTVPLAAPDPVREPDPKPAPPPEQDGPETEDHAHTNPAPEISRTFEPPLGKDWGKQDD